MCMLIRTCVPIGRMRVGSPARICVFGCARLFCSQVLFWCWREISSGCTMCSSPHLQTGQGCFNWTLKAWKISVIAVDWSIYRCMEGQNWEGGEVGCKRVKKKGESESVFAHKVLYVLCHLCSISKSTDSSHPSLWPWMLPEHSFCFFIYFRILEDVLMDGCAASLQAELMPLHGSNSIMSTDGGGGLKNNVQTGTH